MLINDIAGWRKLKLKYLVLDFNGTLAVDGDLLPGVRERLQAVARFLDIHVLTADTFGKARLALMDVPCELLVLPGDRQDRAKLAHVKKLGRDQTVCIGNGRNDRLMLKAAALGIAVVQREGGAVAAIVSAHLVMPGIIEALELLDNPLRLVATLRN